MNLLLSNDDGVFADGINVLAKELAKNHNVFVIAPSGNRSAVSHGLSMFQKLELHEIDKNIWSLSGKPADCVMLGISGGLLPVKIDAVLSGINKGINLGTDITFSGTCAVARHGSFLDIPSIAVSLDCFSDGANVDYSPIAKFVNNNLEKLIKLIEPDKSSHFLNVNAFLLSKLNLENYKGVKFPDSLWVKKYNDKFVFSETADSSSKDVNFVFGTIDTPPDVNTDEYWCGQGYISISKVCSEPQQTKIQADETDFIL